MLLGRDSVSLDVPFFRECEDHPDVDVCTSQQCVNAQKGNTHNSLHDVVLSIGEKMMIFVAMIDISIVTKFTNTQLNGTERFIEQSQQHLGKHKRPETILTLLSSSSGDGQWTFET